MKKILLVGINAKYIHSNPAIYSLKAYAREYGEQVEIAEFTINHMTDDILRDIYNRKPDVICFSCYIWNISQVCSLLTELYKLLPNVHVWLGGPEVSFESEAFLERYSTVRGIMLGEGEITFRELCVCYLDREGAGQETAVGCGESDTGMAEDFSSVAGLLYRTPEGKLLRTGDREPLNMDELPFCYGELSGFENRILYYETSRGCPFRCSYCLSSVEKSLRFKSLELVYRELTFFLEHRVPQVKLVDRTFNCNHDHALAVWRFLKENDNGITNFHFEVSADLLTEEELVLLNSLRPGLVQLEIGVQTTNERTIKEIRRTMELNKLWRSVEQVQGGRNIHQHLDLIAGLPFEDFLSFRNSFNDIYGLRPQQLQLGFLKVLKGSYLYECREEYGLLYHSNPPYEVLSTRWLTYEELLKLKLAEEMLEVYYNSGQFEMTIQVLELSFETPFDLFLELGSYYEQNGLLSMSHSRIRRCEILLGFMKEKAKERLPLYEETLTFDLYLRENMKSRPKWAPDPGSFKQQAKRLCGRGRLSHAEPFFYDFSGILNHNLISWPKRNDNKSFYLFDYENRDTLTHQASVRLCGEPEDI